jgi:hypothetical protein
LPEKYDSTINIRCPSELPKLVASAARSRMTTSSSYVRSALLERLQRDGLAPREAREK